MKTRELFPPKLSFSYGKQGYLQPHVTLLKLKWFKGQKRVRLKLKSKRLKVNAILSIS